MSTSAREAIRDLLADLYGEREGHRCYDRLSKRLDRFKTESSRSQPRAPDLFDERDVVLITYGDTLRRPPEAPLRTLLEFWRARLSDVINTIHILPFYPYSSDDGFSVIDYESVDPALGGWEDIGRFKQLGARLMFDAVINHISARSEWFRRFRDGDEKYRDFFITVDPTTDLSGVTRPRALPLLTPVETAHGTRHVWTTFSADQVDLNYRNPDTLLEVIDVLLLYVERGADLIRLDAIAYLWKEIGTSCIHLPQTHAVVRLIRAVLADVAPSVLLITETNVPHDENVSYFGDGTDESHMVYQFSLPPLVAHAILTGSAKRLSQWARGLIAPSAQTTFFNFTASHDGVGVRPATGILGQVELERLLERTVASGGAISSKANPNGSTSPYELNVNYFDLLNGEESGDPEDLQTQRFLVSQAIMLAMAGIPGIYIHSLLGSRNYTEGVELTGQRRTINREKLQADDVEAALADSRSLRHAVFHGYQHLLKRRIQEPAFHPSGAMEVLNLDDGLFTVVRRSPDGREAILALHNLTANRLRAVLDLEKLRLPPGHVFRDILSGKDYGTRERGLVRLELAPYQASWLKAGATSA